MTWGNQPGTTDTAATTTSGSGYREWNVAGQMQSMYANGNYGFLIRDAREKGENIPQLVISFVPVGQ